MIGHCDLVVTDLADENALLRERLALFESYRELAQTAIAELADARVELEAARRRIIALVNENRDLQRRHEVAAA